MFTSAELRARRKKLRPSLRTSTSPPSQSLDKMTVAQLKLKAEVEGVDLEGATLRADIIARF